MRPKQGICSLVEFVQKGMFYPVLLIFGKGVELYVMNALEDIVFYVFVLFL